MRTEWAVYKFILTAKAHVLYNVNSELPKKHCFMKKILKNKKSIAFYKKVGYLIENEVKLQNIEVS